MILYKLTTEQIYRTESWSAQPHAFASRQSYYKKTTLVVPFSQCRRILELQFSVGDGPSCARSAQRQENFLQKDQLSDWKSSGKYIDMEHTLQFVKQNVNQEDTNEVGGSCTEIVYSNLVNNIFAKQNISSCKWVAVIAFDFSTHNMLLDIVMITKHFYGFSNLLSDRIMKRIEAHLALSELITNAFFASENLAMHGHIV